MIKSIEVGEGIKGPSGRLGFLLRQAQQSFRSAMGRRLQDLQLSASQYTVLSLVESVPNSSGAELAVAGMMTPQSTNELVMSLTRRGLLNRVPRPGDQRVRQVHLTDEGQALMAVARPRVERMEDDLISRISGPESGRYREWLVELALHANAMPARPDGQDADSADGTDGTADGGDSVQSNDGVVQSNGSAAASTASGSSTGG